MTQQLTLKSLFIPPVTRKWKVWPKIMPVLFFMIVYNKEAKILTLWSLSTLLSVGISVCWSFCLSDYPSDCSSFFVFQLVCLFSWLSGCPSVYLSVLLTVRLSFCPSVCLSFWQSGHPSVCQAVCSFLFLSFLKTN